jgi:hypothetical protein
MTVSRGTASAPVYSGGTVPTHLVPKVPVPLTVVLDPIARPPALPSSRDPVAEWLHSEEAARYQGHWVALDVNEGHFLAAVDDIRDRRLWRARDALIIYVDPPEDES